MTKDEKKLLKLRKKSYVCVCPACGCYHRSKRMFWSGIGKYPKLFCENCKKENEDTEEEFSLLFYENSFELDRIYS